MSGWEDVSLGNEAPKVKRNDWASVSLGEEPAVEQEEPRRVGTPADDLKALGDTAKNVGAGIVRSVAGLESLGAMYFENLAAAGEIPFNIAESYITNEPLKPVEAPRYMSGQIQQAGEEMAAAIRPEDQGMGGRFIERAGEYGAPTKLFTTEMISKGKQLLKDNPEWIDEIPEGIGRIEKALAMYAKDPKAAHKLEQTISALQAGTGQTLEELDAPWYVQLLAELGVGFGAGMSQDLVRRGLETAKAKFGGGMEQYGKAIAGKYIDRIIKNDPNFNAKVQEGDRIVGEYGIEMDLGERAANNELKATRRSLINTEIGSGTADDVRKSRQLEQLEESPKLQSDDEAIMRSKSSAEDIVARQEMDYEVRMEDAHQRFLESTSAPTTREGAGLDVQESLEKSRKDIKDIVDVAYSKVGNPTIYIPNTRAAILQARHSPLKKDPYLNELETELITPMEATFLGKEGGTIERGTKKTYRLGRNPKNIKQAKLDALRQLESRLKEKIRIARSGGQNNKARLLNKILQGIWADTRSAKGAAKSDIRKLRRAARLSKLEKDLFDQGEALALTKVSKQGVEAIDTNDVIDHVIRPNSSKNIEKSIEDYYNAVANRYSKTSVNDARENLKDAFLVKVSEIADGGEQAVERFMRNHSRFLQRANLDNEFRGISDVIKQSKKAKADYKVFVSQRAKSELGKYADTDDPVGYVMKKIRDKSISRLLNDVSDNPIILRGVREAAWEGLSNSTITGNSVDAGTLSKLLKTRRKEIMQAVGPGHAKRVEDLVNIINRLKPSSRPARGVASEKYDEQLVERLLTGLRAAAHGFVRPDLIFIQAAMRGKRALSIKEAQKHLWKAINDPEYADALVKLSRKPMGKQVLKTMFASVSGPVVSSTQAEPINQDTEQPPEE